MTWFDKIRLGMELMKKGCSSNQSGADCEKKCPFRGYCWYTADKYQCLPEDWEIENG